MLVQHAICHWLHSMLLRWLCYSDVPSDVHRRHARERIQTQQQDRPVKTSPIGAAAAGSLSKSCSCLSAGAEAPLDIIMYTKPPRMARSTTPPATEMPMMAPVERPSSEELWDGGGVGAVTTARVGVSTVMSAAVGTETGVPPVATWAALAAVTPLTNAAGVSDVAAAWAAAARVLGVVVTNVTLTPARRAATAVELIVIAALVRTKAFAELKSPRLMDFRYPFW